jgi:hypothetical protein
MSYYFFGIIFLACVYLGWKMREIVERRRHEVRTNRRGSVLFR